MYYRPSGRVNVIKQVTEHKMSYTWQLTKFENDFFNKSLYTSFEESSYLDEDSIIVLRDEYIKGNTALFNEITRVISTGDSTTRYIKGDGQYEIVATFSFENNMFYVYDTNSGTGVEFETTEIIDMISWINMSGHLPIYVIEEIYTDEKVIFDSKSEERVKERTGTYKEELMQVTWNPTRLHKLGYFELVSLEDM